MPQNQLVIKNTPSTDEVDLLSKALNINPFLASILIQRGIKTFDEAKHFFRPSLADLHDPFLMLNMHKAVERIEKALAKNEKILVYGDYDVDGTTSVTLVYDFLSNYTSEIDFYIPDRYLEGYGISTKGIDFAKENGFSLIIALDCGIKSPDKIAYANSLNIDFIICDHHNPGDEIPKAVAVLDPKQKDCKYPYKELSGCGVGFKLVQGYCQKNNIDIAVLYPYLDLLAISIGADIVPMTGENRIFCFHGLNIINESPRAGVKALMGVSGFKKKLSISNVVFGLAPRINAAGRIAHAKAAVNLLLAKDISEAADFAKDLNDNNLSRKEIDSSMTDEAILMIETQENYQNLRSTVLFKTDWHKGVIGIVASRCIEKYYRPTIILTASNGKAAGSARSVHGFDIYEAISNCADVLEQYGGHTFAAGMTLKLENVDIFRQKFEEEVSKSISEDSLSPKINVDLEVPLNFVSDKVYKILNQMEPFGPGNMTPVFLTQNLKDGGNSRIVGGTHLKLDLFCPKTRKKIDGIAFGMHEKLPLIKSGNPFSVCYTLDENTYNDITSVQLSIREIF